MILRSIKKAIAVTTGFLVLTSSSSIYASAYTDDHKYELKLSSSSKMYYDDENTLTYFYVDTDYEGETVTLVNADDMTEYTMVDDGKYSVSGDDLPYDGVYSLKMELDASGATYESYKTISFYAIVEDGSMSNTITIKICKRFTNLQLKEMSSVDSEIATLKSSENFMSANNEERAVMMKDLLLYISENGTKEYPYSLIQIDSIELSKDEKFYSFRYYFGFSGNAYFGDLTQFETTTITTEVITTTTKTTVTTTQTTQNTGTSTELAAATETTLTSTADTTAETTVSTETTPATTTATTETTPTSTTDTTEGTTVSTETTPATTTTTEETTLPQTGYSKWYHVAAALAACMTGIGGAMLIGSGVLKKKREIN